MWSTGSGSCTRKTPSVLQPVCLRSQRGLGQAQEQKLHPRAVLSPPGPPSSEPDFADFLIIFLLLLFFNLIPLLLHHRRIRCIVNGRSCPPQRSSTQFQPCLPEFSLCSLNHFTGGHLYPETQSLISKWYDAGLYKSYPLSTGFARKQDSRRKNI